MIKRIYIRGFSSRLYHYLLFFPVIIFLYGCPFSSAYKLDDDPNIYTEDVLLGNWATMITTKSGRQLPAKMILGKKNDTEYTIAFTGYISDLEVYNVITNDTIKGTAFMSTVAGRQFLNIGIKEQNYIAELVYRDNKLSLLPLAEKFTAKYIMSNEDLRLAVEVHVKTRVSPVYDDPFCLRDMVRVK